MTDTSTDKPSEAPAETPLSSLGPAPFRFLPQPGGTLEGPAFSRWFQAITWLTVLGSGYWLLLLWQQGKFGGDTSIEGLKQAGWFIMAWLLLAWTAWHVVHSRMRMDEKGLHQTWIWHKTMIYDDMAYAKLVRVRGLDWLMAPRFYVRTLVGKFAVFYVSDPQIIAECERMQQELKAFRQL